MHFEQIFAEVLGSLQILKVACYVITGNKFLALLSVAVILEDDDFIDLENGGDSCDFTYEVGSEGACLRHLENGVREADS
jgi:hypothetical protein